MSLIGVVFLSFVLIANAIEVQFCSEPYFAGSCATKEYDIGRCEHLPKRFRWLGYSVKSVKIDTISSGGCMNVHCELHTDENCGQSLTPATQQPNTQQKPFDCQRSIFTGIPELTFKSVICSGGQLSG
ncbi:hypothetical protein HA402_004164 [Bradysia odoriphaga]|nr:hypothetical protein HA402_004164 [Bradysia odoriphaga]